MKLSYRGHEIEVKRQRSLGGSLLLYVTIFRERDGFLCTEFVEDNGETVRSMMSVMRERVDNELADPDPWGESDEGRA